MKLKSAICNKYYSLWFIIIVTFTYILHTLKCNNYYRIEAINIKVHKNFFSWIVIADQIVYLVEWQAKEINHFTKKKKRKLFNFHLEAVQQYIFKRGICDHTGF